MVTHPTHGTYLCLGRSVSVRVTCLDPEVFGKTGESYASRLRGRSILESTLKGKTFGSGFRPERTLVEDESFVKRKINILAQDNTNGKFLVPPFTSVPKRPSSFKYVDPDLV